MSLFMEILCGCLLALIVLSFERFYDYYFGSKIVKTKATSKVYNAKLKLLLTEFKEYVKRHGLHDDDILLTMIEDVLNKKYFN